MRLNRVISPVIRCQCIINDTGFGLPKANVERPNTAGINSAFDFEPKILGMDDLDKIKTPVVSYDEEATMKKYHLMREIFDGILEVELFGRNRFNHVPWDDILSWMGIEEGIFNFAVEPKLMHAAVTRYVDAAIAQVKQYENLGLLSSKDRKSVV